MPTPPKTPPAPADPPADPAPTDPAPDDDPRAMLKGIVREVLDEFAAEQIANPKRTKDSKDFLRDLLGIK